MLASASGSVGADKTIELIPWFLQVVATIVIDNQISTSQKTFSDPNISSSCQIVHHINNNNNDNSNGSNNNT